MASVRLTQRTVDAAKPGDADQLLWDEDLRGFGLKITKAGSKTYLIQYRMGGRGAPTRRFTTGKHGSPWTTATARAEAEALLQTVRRGTDPSAAAKEKRRIDFELAFDKYVSRFLEKYGKRHWKATTYASAESDLRRWVTPKLKNTSLLNIKRHHIVAIIEALPATSPALPRNIFRLVRKLFAWAVEQGDIDRSPMEGMKSRPAVASRDRVLDRRELLLIWLPQWIWGRSSGPFFSS